MVSFFEQWWRVWLELAPWMLLGMALAGILHLVIPTRFFQTQLRGPGGVVKATLFGIPLPLCSCGVIPTGIGMKKSGASDGAAIGFLISTPQTGVDSILVSASFLGWPFAFFKMAAALVTGVLGGWIVEATAAKTNPPPPAPPVPAVIGRRRRPREAWLHAVEILQSIWLWLIIGVTVSAAISLWLPREWTATLNEWGLGASMLLMLAISLPWYVCATASIPVAASLVQAGFPTAAAMVFLMAGPATNVATMGAIIGNFGWRVFGLYLAVIVVGSMAAGWLFDTWIGVMTAGADPHAHHVHGTTWWSFASGLILLGSVVAIAAQSVSRRLLRRQSVLVGAEQTFHITEMHCQNCVQKVESSLQKLEGIQAVSVELATGAVRVTGSAAPSAIRRALADCGYPVVD